MQVTVLCPGHPQALKLFGPVTTAVAKLWVPVGFCMSAGGGPRCLQVASGSSQLSPAALLPRRGEEELGTSSLCALLLASSAALRVDWQTTREDSGIQSCTGSVREAFCVCGKSREADISVVGRALCYKVFETPFADWGESWRRQQECCQPSAKC